MKWSRAGPLPQPGRAVRQPREPLAVRPGGEHPFRGTGEGAESFNHGESLRREGHAVGAVGLCQLRREVPPPPPGSRAQGPASASQAPLRAVEPSSRTRRHAADDGGLQAVEQGPEGADLIL